MIKKITFILLLLTTLNIYSTNKQEKKIEQTYSVTMNNPTYKIIDFDTKEELVGVSLDFNGKKYYTDLNGEFKVNNYRDETIKIYLISYVVKEVTLKENERIIELKRF